MKVKVLRPFVLDGRSTVPGEVIDLPEATAYEYASYRKVERVTEAAPETAAAPVEKPAEPAQPAQPEATKKPAAKSK